MEEERRRSKRVISKSSKSQRTEIVSTKPKKREKPKFWTIMERNIQVTGMDVDHKGRFWFTIQTARGVEIVNREYLLKVNF